ncbi:hypothetical protein ABL840_05005 [Variovorax sp. NFACC27]|uniref:hypothetical protein n=1 Tax=unclassified Variovorax TaxID=663243 RepID=UPI00089B022E|nr:hypothetical protein SAMN03159371_00134 [Variovorax sp. NFACC28]SEF71932.1 hypothetical protein SAMN03159365_00684 [Variovorax sp. NFACC29]SFB77017.1 hypothetical protein SAMN03159379_00683 [Variovorax sp. NFACC26]SFG76643.1 hypothetical protein SAMN03159447_04806 [Variovorax sp. NFACC27]
MTAVLKTLASRLRAFLLPSWSVLEESDGSFCLYRQQFGRTHLFERWATLRTAGQRLAELQGHVNVGAVVAPERIANAIGRDVPEESATTPHARVYRGNRAREVLENESFDWAFNTLKSEIVESWQNAPMQDPQGRETLWLSLKLLEKVRSHLVSRLETGKLAQLELKHLAEMEKNAKAWQE